MKTLLTLITTFALITTPAAATVYECVHGKQTFAKRQERRENKNEKDPIYKIVVVAEYHGEPYMTIEHVSINGERYARSEQYPINTLRRNNRGDFIWNGEYIRDPRVTMSGALLFRGNRITYSETRYDRGKFAWRITTTCIPQENE